MGIETYCDNPAAAPIPGGGGGLGLDGGMAEYMLIPDERQLLILPKGLDPKNAAPLTDAGLTPYHAVRRSWPKLTPESIAVVIGVGGLGHMAVQIIKATTAARIIAVDSRDEALALAKSLGADYAIKSDAGTATQIKELTGGHGAEQADRCNSPSSLSLTRQACKPSTGAVALNWQRSWPLLAGAC